MCTCILDPSVQHIPSNKRQYCWCSQKYFFFQSSNSISQAFLCSESFSLQHLYFKKLCASHQQRLASRLVTTISEAYTFTSSEMENDQKFLKESIQAPNQEFSFSAICGFFRLRFCAICFLSIFLETKATKLSKNSIRDN